MGRLVLESGIINDIMESVLGSFGYYKVESKELLLEGVVVLIENSLKSSQSNSFQGILQNVYSYYERLSTFFYNETQKSLVSNEMVESLDLFDEYYRKYG